MLKIKLKTQVNSNCDLKITVKSKRGIVSTLTTKAIPEELSRSGGQGLSAANAMRYAANTPPPADKNPKPVEDLENKNGSNQNTVDKSLIGKKFTTITSKNN